ncbi:hypothetical protein HUX88_23895 [Duganella sp. BJB1802]|uniref:hypothetical protein n=1 Tax=Duganella sp. BJB1802 TaxID=2744575 RepID=UPI00159392BE|nr:hypothetical protein [Duganella sp. BJB1802]NVD73557.1 hypothetical protein [Duganella sp. BJB1802]
MRRALPALLALLLSTTAHAQSGELTVPLAPQQAQQAILQAVQRIPAQQEAHRRYRMALPYGAPLFPPDTDLALAPAGAALAAWLRLPAEQRRHDVLIVPDVDYYWNAEGRRFSCQFIVHVQAADGRSRLAVLQVRPTVYAGKSFKLLGRTGPGMYLDLRPAAPSAQSGAELRAFLASALPQPQ